MSNTISTEGFIDKLKEIFLGKSFIQQLDDINLSELNTEAFEKLNSQTPILTHAGVIELTKVHKLFIEKAIPFFFDVMTSTKVTIQLNNAITIENPTGDKLIEELKILITGTYKTPTYRKQGSMSSLGWSASKLPHLKQLIKDNQQVYDSIMNLHKQGKLTDMYNFSNDLWEHYDEKYRYNNTKKPLTTSQTEFISNFIYERWLEPITILLKATIPYYSYKEIQNTFKCILNNISTTLSSKKATESQTVSTYNLLGNPLMQEVKQIESDGEALSIENCICNLSANIKYIQSLPIDSPVYASEGVMFDWFKSTLISIGNTIGHIGNLHKTNIFKFYKELKRTEIRYYNESNMASMQMLFNLPYNEVCKIQIPIPKGMVCTYGEAVSNITSFLAKINAHERSKVIVLLSKTLMQTIKKGSSVSAILIKQINQCDSVEFKSEYDKYRKCFDIKPTETIAFEKVFASMTDMKKINDTIIANEQYVHAIPMVHASLVDIHNYFTEILKYLEQPKSDVVTKTDIENIAILARAIAETFDFYGTGVMDFHRVEHNVVEVYKELRRQFKV